MIRTRTGTGARVTGSGGDSRLPPNSCRPGAPCPRVLHDRRAVIFRDRVLGFVTVRGVIVDEENPRNYAEQFRRSFSRVVRFLIRTHNTGSRQVFPLNSAVVADIYAYVNIFITRREFRNATFGNSNASISTYGRAPRVLDISSPALQTSGDSCVKFPGTFDGSFYS